MKLKEIEQQYNRSSRLYNFIATILGWMGIDKYRRRAFSDISGKILEVSVGSGKNFQYFPSESNVTAIDISKSMIEIAKVSAIKASIKAQFLVADAEKLPFQDNSFDTVVSSLSTCTFPNPIKALREMKRVCKKPGKVILLEHGISNNRIFAKFQNWNASRRSEENISCHPNRNPEILSKDAGLSIERIERPNWGYFYLIWAKP